MIEDCADEVGIGDICNDVMLPSVRLLFRTNTFKIKLRKNKVVWDTSWLGSCRRLPLGGVAIVKSESCNVL